MKIVSLDSDEIEDLAETLYYALFRDKDPAETSLEERVHILVALDVVWLRMGPTAEAQRFLVRQAALAYENDGENPEKEEMN